MWSLATVHLRQHGARLEPKGCGGSAGCVKLLVTQISPMRAHAQGAATSTAGCTLPKTSQRDMLCLGGATLLLACLLTLSLLHLIAPQPLAEATTSLARHGPLSSAAAHAAPLAIAPLLVCPPGRYRAGAANASEQLRAHWQQLLALGYRPNSVHRGATREA